jgi:rare lipoprotein A
MSAATGVASEDVSEVNEAPAHAGAVDAANPPESLPDGPDALLEQGLATWYGGKRWHGLRTASGERFDRHGYTAAHLTLPIGTTVRVVNQHNGREVLVRINDRGPFAKSFIIDLSEAAAEKLGIRRSGRARVAVYHAVVPPKRVR